MVRKHQTTDTMACRDVWRLACESHLYRGGSPRDEIGELTFSDSEKRLMNLCKATRYRLGLIPV